jgi:hypothetical protein
VTRGRRPACPDGGVRAACLESRAWYTRWILRQLTACGPLGQVAAELVRIQKAGTQAGVYRGTAASGNSFRELALRRKREHLLKLVGLLGSMRPAPSWGWANDPLQPQARWVLCLDLPTGQVSFHSSERFEGPDYTRRRESDVSPREHRILAFCDALLSGTLPAAAVPAAGTYGPGPSAGPSSQPCQPGPRAPFGQVEVVPPRPVPDTTAGDREPGDP